MSRILLVEDEAGMRRVVRDALEQAGHEVDTAANGAEALERLSERSFDLIVTDLKMPGLGGRALVEEVRKGSRVPILVLTVRQEETEKVALLDAGADDYVTKPFGVQELLARVRALLRRWDAESEPIGVFRWADIEVDREARTVRKGSQPIHLTPIEFGLLSTLLTKPGAVWTHRQLLTRVWGNAEGVTNDTLRVHMGSLRRKLESDPNRPRWFHTEPWVGYRFNPEG